MLSCPLMVMPEALMSRSPRRVARRVVACMMTMPSHTQRQGASERTGCGERICD